MAKEEESLYPYIHRRGISKLGQDAAFIKILLHDFGNLISVNSTDKTLNYDKINKLLNVYIKSLNNTIKK